ncbi:MAG: hypothetical protein PHO34_02035 [Candidatus Omnitrophica bacterium]|nr:hypothetical protein [Candidatus Omnitrophota bacterium]MDD5042636.1 hypothetical protein [Candidatus Omnitrophota bacterium]MDD5501030.1 hypothetical protein [Candidatus Omnitrophota bacterium]
MNRKGTVMKFVLIGIIVVSLGLVGLFAYLYQSDHAKCLRLQAQVDELTAREQITQGKLDASQKKISELTLKLQEAKGRIDVISQDLDKERSAREEAARELDQLKTDLEQQKSSRQDIESQLNQAQEEGRKIREQLKVMAQQKVDLEEKIRKLEAGDSGVELGKVVVSGEQPAPEAAGAGEEPKAEAAPAETSRDSAQEKDAYANRALLEGKITVVNKEYSFVVINLGQKDGVAVGDLFSVYQDNKAVGDIRVEKVHESMSAAGFSADLKDKIKENDVVMQKVK